MNNGLDKRSMFFAAGHQNLVVSVIWNTLKKAVVKNICGGSI